MLAVVNCHIHNYIPMHLKIFLNVGKAVCFFWSVFLGSGDAALLRVERVS